MSSPARNSFPAHPVGIGWEGAPYRFDDGDDPDALPSRIHAARDYNSSTYLVGWASEVTYRELPKRPRPSLWSRVKSWAENLFADPEGDDE